jgi:hypothetical protein
MNTQDKPQPTFRDHPWRISYRTSSLTPDGKPLNILQDFYLPALRRAVAYDRVAGYFRSSSLAAASQGFSAFVANQGKVRLIVGADLDPRDVQTVLEYSKDPSGAQALEADPLENLLNQELGDQESWSEPVKNGVQLLAYLLAEEFLEIRVAFRINAETSETLSFDSVEDGYVHMKWGLFRDREGNRLYISGSLNESKQALTLNAENIDVHCDWKGDTDRLRVEEAEQEFESLWADENPSLRVLTLPEAVKKRLIKVAEGVSRPVEIDGTSDVPLQVAPPSALEWLRFALIKDGPKLPGGLFVGMETAPVKPWPHQEVVARRIIETWPFSYLLCDEVGLGKTIEAGLIIRSLYLSGLIKRVFIAAPASLTKQWQREMATKFLLPFARTTGGAHPTHEYLLPFEYQETSGSLFSPDLNILSTGLLTRQDREGDLATAANFDLTLVDEAHYARRQNPTRGNREEPRFGRLHRVLTQHVRPKSASLLLATATPMQLDPIEVFDLIQLTKRVGAFLYDPSLAQWYYDILGRLVHGGEVSEAEWAFLRKAILAIQNQDPSHFAYLQNVVVDPTIRLAVRIWLQNGQPPTDRDLPGTLRLIFAASPLCRVMLRHNRALLEIYRANGQLDANLAERIIYPLPRITFTPQEQHCYDQLEQYCRELAVQVQAGGNRTQQIAILGFYLSFLRLRFASSLFAIRQTLRRRLQRVKATLREFILREGEVLSNLDLEDLLEEGDDDTPFVEAFLENRRPEDLKWEYHYLTQMLQPLEDLSGPSSKMQFLLRALDERRISGTNRLQQTVIFSRFYDTLTDIVERLRRVEGRMLIGTYSGQGGQYTDTKKWRLVGADREDIKRRFLRGEIDVLVCTDAAAEGLNLQTADLLINFDLPWNPMKVEQRIGRIDRIGQKYDRVYVLNLCYAGSAEEIVYGRLLHRLADIGAIVGSQQISLLPVTREEFQELAEKKLSEVELERRAKERIEAAKRQAMSREIPAQDLYHIYTRLAQPVASPISLDSIWEALSQSKYLQDLGCLIFPDIDKRTIVLQNMPGVLDGTGLTVSREVYEYGIEGFEGSLHFASHGDFVFEAVVNQILSFEPPRGVKKIEVSRPGNMGIVVSYAISSFDEGGNRGIKVLSSLNELANLRIHESSEITDAEYDYLLSDFQKKITNEFRYVELAEMIQVLNEEAGLCQLLLDYLIVESILKYRKELEESDQYFWTEVKLLDSYIAEKESVLIPDIPPIRAQKLHDSLFEITLPATGGPARMNAPNFLLRGSMDAVCRLASRRRIKKAELLTNDVIAALEREISRS